jgi:signal transduction histidine kinase
LRVISRSQTDVQPVFDTIAKAALELCRAKSANVFTYDGELVNLASFENENPEYVEVLRQFFPRPPSRDTAVLRAILTRTVVAIPDVLDDKEYQLGAHAPAGGFRSVLAVPLIREGNAIGGIAVGRTEPGPFPDVQIALLQTFADQAIIAIENVRLFKELEARTTDLTRSVGELKALGEVGQAVSSTLELETVLSTIVSRAAQLAGMDGGSIWEYDETREQFSLHATDRLPDELVEVLRATPIKKGEGALGRLAVTGEPVAIRDIVDERNYQSRVREILIRCGYRSVLAVPLLREDHLLGALAVNRRSPGEFAPEVIDLLKTFATQSALAIQNARLFREIEDKGRQLETASRHKSEFLANMSHELRTPLNAIIGFSEVLSERMFGEINDKQAEYLADILESGRHLLSLINDILDLSKIEAGRMELESTDFDLPNVIETTLILVRERAHRRGITLGHAIDADLTKIRADERKVKQVLLNLLSNALKFTPEGGRIDVRARRQESTLEVSVADTGVGIAPEDQEAVFEEFRQVGTAAKKVEGTGLGLAISRKFIELHGGRIWVKSQEGSGSTFAFSLPLPIDPPRQIS